MIIRGRSDKNPSAMQQYASHELPQVVLGKQNSSVGREHSERGRRRLSQNSGAGQNA